MPCHASPHVNMKNITDSSEWRRGWDRSNKRGSSLWCFAFLISLVWVFGFGTIWMCRCFGENVCAGTCWNISQSCHLSPRLHNRLVFHKGLAFVNQNHDVLTETCEVFSQAAFWFFVSVKYILFGVILHQFVIFAVFLHFFLLFTSITDFNLT